VDGFWSDVDVADDDNDDPESVADAGSAGGRMAIASLSSRPCWETRRRLQVKTRESIVHENKK